MRYLVGIDNGSQSTKVTIYDELGGVASTGRVPLRPCSTPRPGVVEHPDDDLWDSIAEACRRAVAGFGGDRADIVGVGLCTIRFCRAVLRADGTLAQPVISWMDERAGRPYAAERADAAVVTTSSGYITHRLTGRFRDTAANCAGIWPVDPQTWDWSADEGALAEAGLRREQLVELVAPGDVLGRMTAAAAAATGLPAGLPVVATANDKAVEALGSGLRSPGDLLVSLGTYIAAMSVGPRPAQEPRASWTNFAATPGEHLHESGGIRRGMWTISWLRDLVLPSGSLPDGGPRAEEVLNLEAAAVPAGSDGLMTVLDWLAPAEAPWRRGSVLGFDHRHGRGHLYRSLLEGIALTVADRAELMREELSASYARVLLTGGGAASDVMVQVVADVFALPVARRPTDSAAGLGAAVLAAVATGVHPDVDTALAAMLAEPDVVQPAPEGVATYRRLRPLHASLAALTDQHYRRLAELA